MEQNKQSYFVSVIIPVYNEAQSIKILFNELHQSLGSIEKVKDYEVIFIDDGSTDNSLNEMVDLQHQYDSVKIVKFSRNMGKTTALQRGFKAAQGDIAFTLDADLQDDPKELARFLDKLDSGFDLVSGYKRKRLDSIVRVAGSRLFNFIISKLSGIRLHDFNCGFKAYRKHVYKQLMLYGEQHRFIPMIAHKMGFKVGEIVVHHRERKYGKSKYPAFRFKALFDAISVHFLYSSKDKPLHMFGLAAIPFIFSGAFMLLGCTLLFLNNMMTGSGNSNIFFAFTALLLLFFIILSVSQLICNGLIAELIVHTNIKQNDPGVDLVVDMENTKLKKRI